MKFGPLQCGALALALSLLVPAVKAQDDVATLYEQTCGMCHSEDLADQQRLSLVQWTAVVQKMEKWGAPLEEGQAAMLAAWLAARTPPTAADVPPPTVTLAAVVEQRAPRPEPEAPPSEVADMAPEHWATHCASCHGFAAEGRLAPALIKRSVIFRPEEWAKVVNEGRKRMPSLPEALGPQEVEALRRWVAALP